MQYADTLCVGLIETVACRVAIQASESEIRILDQAAALAWESTTGTLADVDAGLDAALVSFLDCALTKRDWTNVLRYSAALNLG